MIGQRPGVVRVPTRQVPGDDATAVRRLGNQTPGAAWTGLVSNDNEAQSAGRGLHCQGGIVAGDDGRRDRNEADLEWLSAD